ncbi:hypothetical protein HDU67_001138 [Dinochytrium kinnereticum]|nr:hypothetical protein HDU67_001138 [Dinochytrium kinnereticum]
MCPLMLTNGVDCGTCITESPAHRETAATVFFGQLSEACAAGAAGNDFVAAASLINPVIRQSLSTVTPSSASNSVASTTARTSSTSVPNGSVGILTNTVTAELPKNNMAAATGPQSLLSTAVALVVVGFVASVAL